MRNDRENLDSASMFLGKKARESKKVCSTPASRTKTKGNCESSCLLFWVPAALSRLHLSVVQCAGRPAAAGPDLPLGGEAAAPQAVTDEGATYGTVLATGIPRPASPGASLPLLSRCARHFPIPSVAARHLPLIRGVGPLTGGIGLSQGGRGGRCAVSRTRRGPPEGASRRRP